MGPWARRRVRAARGAHAPLASARGQARRQRLRSRGHQHDEAALIARPHVGDDRARDVADDGAAAGDARVDVAGDAVEEAVRRPAQREAATLAREKEFALSEAVVILEGIGAARDDAPDGEDAVGLAKARGHAADQRVLARAAWADDRDEETLSDVRFLRCAHRDPSLAARPLPPLRGKVALASARVG